jgi:poly-gamma-glutamate capsule biosynthesis protein CapA/YwtB (metallophosphatase superfamily)
MSITVNIAGDFCITPSYVDKELLAAGIKELYAKADINIVNLECPVNNHGDRYKIVKYGPHLGTTEKIFDHLKALNVTAVTLANNHILDYGVQGLESTLDACERNNIAVVGVGNNLDDAGKFLLLEKNNIKIAIVNFCENEWSIATDETAGANPLDIINNLAQIKKAKQAADVVLVIIHGGNEYYNLPSPRMVKQYRFFAENGADAVIGHHTHCISGYEIHNNIPIVYGLGNMLFTKPSIQNGWDTGLTAQLTIEKNKPVQFYLIPTTQAKDNYTLSLLEGKEKQEVLKEAESYSAVIADDKKLKTAWQEVIEKRSPMYLFNFSPAAAAPGKYAKGILKKLGLVDKMFPQKYVAGILNYINCEAHLDIAAEALKKKLFKK